MKDNKIKRLQQQVIRLKQQFLQGDTGLFDQAISNQMELKGSDSNYFLAQPHSVAIDVIVDRSNCHANLVVFLFAIPLSLLRASDLFNRRNNWRLQLCFDR